MRRAVVGVVIALLALYGLFEARQLIAGPSIAILAPVNGSATWSPFVTVEGVAENISFLTINDAPAYTDESGRFHEILTPPPGVSVLKVAATDRFGRNVQKIVSINLVTYCYESQG